MNPTINQLKRAALAFVVACICCGCVTTGRAQAKKLPNIDVRLVTDEAEAVLSILAKRGAREDVTESDWQRLFTSEGYTRLKQRELAMQRPFEDADFRTFVLSEELSRRASALKETLDKWQRANISASAGLALAYLPKNARIRATIYPVIKPRDNTFVFDIPDNPAIFFYLDPKMSTQIFANYLTHELHHIGYGTGCPAKSTENEIGKLAPNKQAVIKWLGGFGEGFAMLAAAGGPNIHPHAVSAPEDRARWDRDMANFDRDLKSVEAFLLALLDNRLSENEAREKGFSFFGVQGPWYTVGWKMAVLIEKTYGRAKLIAVFCDHRKLLAAYNRAAARYNRRSRTPLTLWSKTLIDALDSPKDSE